MAEFTLYVTVELPDTFDEGSPMESLASIVLGALRDGDVPVGRFEVIREQPVERGAST